MQVPEAIELAELSELRREGDGATHLYRVFNGVHHVYAANKRFKVVEFVYGNDNGFKGFYYYNNDCTSKISGNMAFASLYTWSISWILLKFNDDVTRAREIAEIIINASN